MSRYIITDAGPHPLDRFWVLAQEAVSDAELAMSVGKTEAEIDAAGDLHESAVQALLALPARNVGDTIYKLSASGVCDGIGRQDVGNQILNEGCAMLDEAVALGRSHPETFASEGADPVSLFWEAFHGSKPGTVSEDDFNAALVAMDTWAPTRPIDFVRKFFAMFDQGGSPSEARLKLLLGQARPFVYDMLDRPTS